MYRFSSQGSAIYRAFRCYPNCMTSYNIGSATKSYRLYHQNRSFILIKSKQFNLFYAHFPNHSIINLPNLSPTMETGTVVSWAKSEGDQVSEGDLLAEIETDKATMSLDASDEGFIAKILIPAGTKDIPVGTPLCVVVTDSENVSAFKDFLAKDVLVCFNFFEKNFKASKTVKKVPPKSAPSPETAAAQSISQPIVSTSPTIAHSGQRVFISPLARRLAKENNIDINTIGIGSGLLGMIVANDLANIKSGLTPSISRTFERSADSVISVPLNNMRAVIAKRLLESKRTIPHYYLTVDINIKSALELRKQMNSRLAEKKSIQKISLNDLIIKAVSCACIKVPECNSYWMNDHIEQHKFVDVSVAVATPNGLITPIVKDAHLKSLTEISANIKELAGRARDNKLQPSEFQGGTITISNLGMFGINNFSAIINPPQACILAVGSTRKQLSPNIDYDSHNLQFHDIISVTLCCDHRVVDGAVGAQWLKEFKETLENPGLMLM